MTDRKRPTVRRVFRSPFRRTRIARDVDDEIRFHLEERTRRLVEQGMDPSRAREEADRRFGNVEEVRQRMERMTRERASRKDRSDTLDELSQDLRFALRQLVRNPVFAVVAVLTLGLGIGANAAIYSVVDGILFKPLPYPESEQLVAVWADYTRKDGPLREWLSYGNFHDLREQSESLEALALFSPWGPTLSGRGEPQQLLAARVSEGMFRDVLQVPPTLGRTFSDAEHGASGPRAVLLSHGFWQRALGGDPGVLGSALDLDGVPYTIAGVMPEGFHPPFAPNANLWAPLAIDPANPPCGRGCAVFRSIGRLAPGVTPDAATTETDGIGARLERAYPEANTGVGFHVAPLRQDMVSTASTTLWILLGAVAFVLLIACVNVANLLLGRAATRRGELAVRSALGAGGRRIARQLLTESVLIAALGGILAVAIGWFGTEALLSLAPAGTPRIGDVTLNIRVLGYVALVSVAAGLAFGTAPAIRASRRDLTGDLREGGRSGGAGMGGRGLRQSLVVSQVALALVLLVGAGLLLRSFVNLRRADLGFQPEGVVTLFVNLPGTRYPDGTAAQAFYRDLEARIGALPGVTRVGSVSSLPLSSFDGDLNFTVEGQPMPEPGEENVVWFRQATPGYLETMSIPLIAGRGITAADDAQARPVVVVNETLAHRYFEGQDPVGRRLNVNDPQNPVWREIVGVAADVRNFGIRQESRNALYAPHGQSPSPAMFVTIAAAVPPDVLIPQVRGTVAELDPVLAIARASEMESIVNASLAPDRFVTALLALFATIALVLAIVGIYGIIAYSVTSRFREMGLRIALGGSASSVSRMVVGQSLGLIAVGVVLGLVGVFIVTRSMGALLFGVSPMDPPTVMAVVGVLALVGTAASLVPARRAGTVDPVTVLKSD